MSDGGVDLRLWRGVPPLILSGLVLLLAAPACLGAPDSITVNAPTGPLSWPQSAPLPIPGVDRIQTVQATLYANQKDGYVDAVIGPLTRTTDGAVLPGDRLVHQDPITGAYVPFPTAPLCQVTSKGTYPFSLNVGVFLQPTDAPGLYSGQITLQYVRGGSTKLTCALAVAIEITSWAAVTVSVNPIPIVSATFGPYDDLTGQTEIAVTANSTWTLSMCAVGDLITAGGAVLHADQVQYALDPAGPWTSLPLVPLVLASGTGNRTFTLYLRIVNPIDRQGGSYAGGLSFSVTSP